MSDIVYVLNEISKNNSGYFFQHIKDRKLSDIFHSHNFYEAIICVSGEFVHKVNSEINLRKSGDCDFIVPGDKHCILSQSEKIEIICISVDCSQIKALEAFYENDIKTGVSFNMKEKLGEIKQLCDFASFEYENTVLYKMITAMIFENCIKLRCVKSILPDFLKKLCSEMNETDNLKAGIDRMVMLSGYSRVHLTRLIKKHFNLTPHQFLLRERMKKAYELTVYTQLPVEVISEAIGYDSFSHFLKIFKKFFNTTPSKLRKSKGMFTI